MPDNALRILVVHSSAELYGSDRSLLDFVRHRPADMQVTVALPEYGELVPALTEAGASVVVGDVCKIQRGMFSPIGILRTIRLALRAVRFLSRAHKSVRFDLVYSNTIAVLGGALCARLWGVPHVWHVREILSSSKVLTSGFRRIVAMLSSTVVCNSGPTLEWVRLKNSVRDYLVVWNGFDVPVSNVDRNAERERLGVGTDDVLFVLVGRISARKGQKLLVQAFAKLVVEGKHTQARLAIVGSPPPGQEYYVRELVELVTQSGCSDRICILPYSANIESVWIAADAAVVPSTEPESFGRVAIEAMGFSRPVIAAAHGGVVEIVVDGVTGLLVSPRDVNALSKALETLLREEHLRHRMGQAGQVRQKENFSVASYVAKLAKVLRSSALPSK